MSITFFASELPFDDRVASLELNTSSAMAAHLTVMLGIDTHQEIAERGMVAGEVSASTLKDAVVVFLAAA